MTEPAKVDELNLDSRLTLEVIKQQLLIKLMRQVGGKIDLTAAEVYDTPAKQVDMTTTQVGEGEPIFEFSLNDLVRHQD